MGYWISLGAKVLVDWCESNYVHSYYVAEWWNILLGLFIIVFGVVGFFCWWVLEIRVWVCYLLLTVVGLGMVGFYGMLFSIVQVVDELSMIYGSLVLLYCFVNSDRVVMDFIIVCWRKGLMVYVIFFMVGYYFW